VRVLPAPVKVRRPEQRRPRPLVQPQDARQRGDLKRAPQRVGVEREDDARAFAAVGVLGRCGAAELVAAVEEA
jgi:hypothetical protein